MPAASKDIRGGTMRAKYQIETKAINIIIQQRPDSAQWLGQINNNVLASQRLGYEKLYCVTSVTFQKLRESS